MAIFSSAIVALSHILARHQSRRQSLVRMAYGIHLHPVYDLAGTLLSSVSIHKPHGRIRRSEARHRTFQPQQAVHHPGAEFGVMRRSSRASPAFAPPSPSSVPLLLAVGVKPVYAVAVGVPRACVGEVLWHPQGPLASDAAGRQPTGHHKGSLRGVTLDIDIPTSLGAPFRCVGFMAKGRRSRRRFTAPVIPWHLSWGLEKMLVTVFISPKLSTFLGAPARPSWAFTRFRVGSISARRSRASPRRPAMMANQVSEQSDAAPVMSLTMSFLPYIVLTAVTLSVLSIPALDEALRHMQIGLPFQAVETGFGVQRRLGRKLCARYSIHTSWNDAVDAAHHHLVRLQCGRLLPRLGGA